MLFDKGDQILTADLEEHHCLADHHCEDQDVIQIEDSHLLAVGLERLRHRYECIVHSN